MFAILRHHNLSTCLQTVENPRPQSACFLGVYFERLNVLDDQAIIFLGYFFEKKPSQNAFKFREKKRSLLTNLFLNILKATQNIAHDSLHKSRLESLLTPPNKATLNIINFEILLDHATSYWSVKFVSSLILPYRLHSGYLVS